MYSVSNYMHVLIDSRCSIVTAFYCNCSDQREYEDAVRTLNWCMVRLTMLCWYMPRDSEMALRASRFLGDNIHGSAVVCDLFVLFVLCSVSPWTQRILSQFQRHDTHNVHRVHAYVPADEKSHPAGQASDNSGCIVTGCNIVNQQEVEQHPKGLNAVLHSINLNVNAEL